MLGNVKEVLLGVKERLEHNQDNKKVSFAEVYQEELALPKIGVADLQNSVEIPQDELHEKVWEKGLLGIAFSGGGIRSATFNLGVIQALCELKLLRRVSYLSTVSGGGYIGGWLTALIHRRYAKYSSENTREILSAEESNNSDPATWPRSIEFQNLILMRSKASRI